MGRGAVRRPFFTFFVGDVAKRWDDATQTFMAWSTESYREDRIYKACAPSTAKVVVGSTLRFERFLREVALWLPFVVVFLG